MKKQLLIHCLLLTLIFPLPAQQIKVKDLPPEYQKWLEEEVVYIITPREREVFLQLQSNKERDIFIQAFWRQRDPTPGTPANEFKTEHFRRIEYADKFFGRETSRPGWRTDRGKIYIILGEPLSIDRFEGMNEIHATRIWTYQGFPEYGLPARFNVVFFKRDGFGEFVLYSPAGDGPHSLLSYVGSQMDVIDIESAYYKLYEIQPDIAIRSLSLIPGEQVYPGQVSLASDIMLSRVQELPQKKVSSTYADVLLRYKDIVEVDYSANYVGNDSFIQIIQDDSGVFFVHYSIEPDRLSVNTYEDKYYTNFQIHGNVQDLKGKTIFQFEKNLPLEFSKEQISSLGSQDFALQDMFPLIPGDYKFNILLKNTVAKEFSSFESTISIPTSTSSPFISQLLLGYKVEKVTSASMVKPFQIKNNHFWAQPQKIFLSQENLYTYFQIFGLTEGLKRDGSIKYSIYKGEQEITSRVKNIQEYPDKFNFIEEFELKGFPPGDYKIKIDVLDETQAIILHGRENFQISSVLSLPRPLVVFKSTPIAKKAVFFHMLGVQLLNKGEINGAKAQLEKAFQQNPREVRFALDLGQALYLMKKFDMTKQTLLPFYGDDNKNPAVLELLAKSFQASGEFKQAIVYYKEYLIHYGTNFKVLNSIGECYYELAEFQEALYAWEKSLEINPKQEDISKKITSIKRENQ